MRRSLMFISVLMFFAINLLGQSESFIILDSSVMSAKYWKIWNTAVEKKMDSLIDRNRKAEATISLKGMPKGYVLKIEQLTHDFYFGASIFNFDQLGASRKNNTYKGLFGSLFNSATVPFYWKPFETQPNRLRFRGEYWDTEEFWNKIENAKEQFHWRRPATDPIIEYLVKAGVRIKGHTMVWGNKRWQKPEWLFNEMCPPEEREKILKLGGMDSFDKLNSLEMEDIAPKFGQVLQKEYRKRVIELSQSYPGKIESWDVVNESARDFHGESVNNRVYYNNSVYGVMPGDYIYNGFKTANEFLPEETKININEITTIQNLLYINQVKDLIAHGCRIDRVGSQMHLFNPELSLKIANGDLIGYNVENPDKVWMQMDSLSSLGLPIAVSEITIPAPLGKNGSQIQAIIAKNLYRLWFSIGNIDEITWWNAVDGGGAPGEPTTSGIMDENLNPKPVYYVLNHLINKEWKTIKELTLDARGRVTFRGFKGDYLLTWKYKTGELRHKRIHIGENSHFFDLNN